MNRGSQTLLPLESPRELFKCLMPKPHTTLFTFVSGGETQVSLFSTTPRRCPQAAGLENQRGLQASITSITQELVRHGNSQAHLRATESDTPGSGPAACVLTHLPDDSEACSHLGTPHPPPQSIPNTQLQPCGGSCRNADSDSGFRGRGLGRVGGLGGAGL